MDLTTLTLDEFLNEDVSKSTPSASVHPFETYSAIFAHLVREKFRDLNEEYALHRLDDFDLGDVALLWNGELVGFYHGNLLLIGEDHQGLGLSVPLILEACKPRPIPAPRTLTDMGRGALTLAWKVAKGITKNPWS